MPTGRPGTGPYAGRRRARSEPARRTGALSAAEQNVIEALAADQPSDASEKALERQVHRLARVLRRSPAAVEAQLARAKAKLQARAEAYVDLHWQAARVAAARGSARAAQWALEHMRVVEPIEKPDAGPKVQIVVGTVLPGLREDLPAVTVLPVPVGREQP